jgi:hypothetical protein
MLSYNSQAFKTVACVVASALFLGACAQCGPELTSTQKQFCEGSKRFDQTVATGAVAGALLGAIAGAMLDRNNRGQGAAIGAVAGGAIGAGTGYYVATSNERYATQEAALNAKMQAAQRETSEFRQLAQISSRLTAENQAKIADLDRRYQNKEISAAAYRQNVASMRQDVERLQRVTTEADKIANQMRQDASRTSNTVGSQNLRNSANEIQLVRNQIAQNQVALERALATVPTGG